MNKEKKLYFTKYKSKEIKKIMRELKNEYKFTTGCRFLGVPHGFIFRVRDLDFYKFDILSRRQFLISAKYKVSVEEKENGSLVSLKELSPVSWGEMLLILLLSAAIIAFVAFKNNLDILSVLPATLLIIAGFLAINWLIFYFLNKNSDRSKECKYKAQMFLKNRLELKEVD